MSLAGRGGKGLGSAPWGSAPDSSCAHRLHACCACRDGAEEEEPLPEGLDDKVVAVYRGVGKLLSRCVGWVRVWVGAWVGREGAARRAYC